MTTNVPMPALGPRRPVAVVPPRGRPSVRRTTTIDCTQATGPGGGRRLLVDGRGRDARTTPAGDLEVVAEASMRVVLDGPVRTVVELVTEPGDAALEGLVGTSTYAGFRKALASLGPAAAPPGSVLHLLLDDLVGAVVVAGYGEVQAGILEPELTSSDDRRARLDHQRDLCAGWATGGGMMRSVEATGTTPMPPPAPAPSLARADDPDAWHAVAPLALHATRRRRRLDVAPDGSGSLRFDVHFRDTHAVEPDVEGIFHEYTLTGTVAGGRLVAVDAAGHVLPWFECPGALGSERRVVGRPLDEVRDLVRRELRGTSTCTHLNDALRSLADLDQLGGLLGRAGPG